MARGPESGSKTDPSPKTTRTLTRCVVQVVPVWEERFLEVLKNEGFLDVLKNEFLGGKGGRKQAENRPEPEIHDDFDWMCCPSRSILGGRVFGGA